jgi:hypothetical protein
VFPPYAPILAAVFPGGSELYAPGLEAVSFGTPLATLVIFPLTVLKLFDVTPVYCWTGPPPVN